MAAAATVISGCSSSRDERADVAEAKKSGEESGDVLAAFEAWAEDSGSDSESSGAAGQPGGAGASPGSGALDGAIKQKVGACWKQPFAMPRLAKVRLLVQFNPDGTVRGVTPRPEASEAGLYRTETPYIVMIAHASQALRQCQPYEVVRANYQQLSQVEMVFDVNNLRN